MKKFINANGLTFVQFLQKCKAKLTHPDLEKAWKENKDPTELIEAAQELFTNQQNSFCQSIHKV